MKTLTSNLKIGKNVVVLDGIKYAIPNTGHQINLNSSIKIGMSKYFKVI